MNYFKIKINSIHPSKALTFNLYVRLGERLVLYVRQGDQLSYEKISTLSAKDRNDVFFIQSEDKQLYKDFIHDQITSVDLSPLEKAQILRESSMMMVEELFEKEDVNEALMESREMIQEFVEFVDIEPEAIAHLIGLSSHDFYTYQHSLDVSIYCLGLARTLGFAKHELEEIALGGLLHDVGKKFVPLEILCKQGPLDDNEWALMQKHPDYGLSIVLDSPHVTDGIKACIYEHHESFAGNGYPQGLAGREIHPLARLVTICDTYDAMTTQRSYNVPLSPTDALNLMHGRLKGKFDPEFIEAMYSVLFKMTKASA